MLLPEEVRRAMAFFEWRAKEWERWAGQREGSVRAEILEGMIGYAHRQARLMRALATSGRSAWAKTASLRLVVSGGSAGPNHEADGGTETREDRTETGRQQSRTDASQERDTIDASGEHAVGDESDDDGDGDGDDDDDEVDGGDGPGDGAINYETWLETGFRDSE